jgi:triacylglycerol lipase
MGTLVGALGKGVREVLDVLDIIDGMKDLTTSSMRAFNEKYNDNENVKYFCIAGQGRNDSSAKTCKALLPTHAYIKTKTGKEEPNDSMVLMSGHFL